MISRFEQLSASFVLSLLRVRVTSDARIPSRILSLSLSLLDDASLERDLRTSQSPDPDNLKAIEGAYPKERVTDYKRLLQERAQSL